LDLDGDAAVLHLIGSPAITRLVPSQRSQFQQKENFFMPWPQSGRMQYEKIKSNQQKEMFETGAS
jgi:hypothetical protein